MPLPPPTPLEVEPAPQANPSEVKRLQRYMPAAMSLTPLHLDPSGEMREAGVAPPPGDPRLVDDPSPT